MAAPIPMPPTADDAEPLDVGNPQHVQSRKQAAKLQQQRAGAAFKQLMSTADGRLWVWQLLGECGVFRSSFDPHGGRMNFNEGRRDIGLQVLDQINAFCPEQYAVMQKENSNG